MNSPNSAPLLGETDDDDDSVSKNGSKKSSKPLTGNSISFLMNTDRSTSEKQAQLAEQQTRNRALFELFQNTSEDEDNSEEDEDSDSEAAPVGKKRKKAGRSIRRLFKRRRQARQAARQNRESATAQTPAAETPVAAAAVAEAAPSPDSATPAEITETTVNLHNSEPASHTERQSTEGEPEPEPEPGPDSQDTVENTPAQAAANTASSPNTAANTASSPNTAANTANTAPAAPAGPAGPPPRPPRPTTPNFGPTGPGGPIIPPNPALYAANAMPNPAAAANLNRAPQTVVERRGGAGPLIAFLAANYLSRRRDRKINRRINKTDKQAKAGREQLSAEHQRISAAETQNRSRDTAQDQRLSTLERTVAIPTTRVETPAPSQERPSIAILHNTHEQTIKSAAETANIAKVPESPVPLPAFEAVPVIKKEYRVAEPPSAKNEQSFKHEKHIIPEAPEQLPPVYERQAKETVRNTVEQAVKEQVHEQIDAMPAREAYFDRRHEVKDDPGSPAAAIAGSRSSQSQPQSFPATAALPPVGQGSTVPAGSQLQVTQAKTQQDLYKGAMRGGFYVGVATIIIGTAAYFILTK
jgi:hypothetical protein